MYDAEDEAWKDLAWQQDQRRMHEEFYRYFLDRKPEGSPAVLLETFAAGWRARSEAR